MLLRQPGFTVIAVLTLALGIGATTAIFSVVNAVLLRPLAWAESDRLVWVGQQYSGDLEAAGEPKFLYWREHAQSFEALMAAANFGGANGNLTGGREPEYVNGLRVSADFFKVLRVQPAFGRAFTAADDQPGGERVAIISDELWRRSFNADPAVIGRTLSFNDQPLTIIGVMPPGFKYQERIDLYQPLRAVPTANYDPNTEVVGRLKPGVTISEAQAEMKLLAEQYRAAFPGQMLKNESVGVRSYQQMLTGDSARLLWLLLGAVLVLLLIACANVANLQLTRAAARQREFVIRQALGAGNWRVMRQLLCEGLVLSLIGGAGGVLLAVWGTDLLAGLLAQGDLPRASEIGFDWRVLGFALLASVVTGLLFGLAPAWQARRLDLNSTLKEGAGRGGTERGRLRSVLVVAEIALSLVLLTGCGLLVRTLVNLSREATGFESRNVLTLQIEPNGSRYDTSEKTSAFYHRALERLSALPGIEAAAVTNILPLKWQFNMPVFVSDQPDQARSVQLRLVTPDYFNALKIPLRQGRVFAETDKTGNAPVVIVNEAFVRRFFSNRDVYQQRFSIGRNLGELPRQVVGVVGDVKQRSLDQPAPPMVYVPLAQTPDKLLRIVRHFTPTYFVVRTNADPHAMVAAIRQVMAEQDPTLPLYGIHTLEEVLAESIAPQRVNAGLFGLFAALGLLLAATGIYGVMSYTVAQRTPEIGIRMALGAQQRDVRQMVIRQGMKLALAGIAFGLAAAFGLMRLMSGLLFGVQAADPLTYLTIVLLLTVTALVACWIPARRATRVDPMVALRTE